MLFLVRENAKVKGKSWKQHVDAMSDFEWLRADAGKTDVQGSMTHSRGLF